MNAIDRLLIHLEIESQGGNWNVETRLKMPQEDTPRDKWAKILLRIKGNIPVVFLQKTKYPQQQTEKIHTKSSDRQKQKTEQEKQKKENKHQEPKKKQTKTMGNRTRHTE